MVEYDTLKSVLCGNKDIATSKEIERCLLLTVDILYSWLESCEYTRDFDMLLYTIKDDYKYTGTLYRGLTLVKNESHDIYFDTMQSFSKCEKVAIEFAENDIASIGDYVKFSVNSEDAIYVILKVDVCDIGVDLHKFALDLTKLINMYVSDLETKEDLNELLSFLLEEYEVLIFGRELYEIRDSIDIMELGKA